MAVVINIMQMSIQTINVTNSSLIAKAIGEKDDDKIKLISGNSIMLNNIYNYCINRISDKTDFAYFI